MLLFSVPDARCPFCILHLIKMGRAVYHSEPARLSKAPKQYCLTLAMSSVCRVSPLKTKVWPPDSGGLKMMTA
jgi:hypothetical protein